MKFHTKLWHPNVSSETGAIRLIFLASEWTMALSIRILLVMLCALLSAPEPDNFEDAVAAHQYNYDI